MTETLNDAAADPQQTIAELQSRLGESLARETATAEVMRLINASPGDLAPVFDAIVEKAMRFCDAGFGGLWLVEDDLARAAATRNVPDAYIEFLTRRPVLLGEAFGPDMKDRPAVHIADLAATESYRRRNPGTVAGVELGGIRTYLTVPLRDGNTIAGVFSLYRKEVRRFTDQQIALVQTFADQAVIAIKNARLFNEVQARTREVTETLEYQTATSDVLNVISRSPNDLQPVMDTIVHTARRLCQAEYALMLHLTEGGLYRIVAHSNASKELFDWMHYNPVTAGDGSAVGIVATTKKTVHLPDSLADPRFTDLRRQQASKARTMLGVPLLRAGEVIGVIFLARTEVKPFGEKQIELVNSFADQAVIAIENVRLFDEVKARTRDLTESLQQQTATADVLKVISSSPGELEPVFQAMLENAVRLCEAKFAQLFLYEKVENEYRAVGKWNLPPGWSEFLGKNTIRADPMVPLGRVAMTKQPVQIADVLADQAYIDRRYPGMVAIAELGGARTLLVVPMLKENELVGAFGIYRQEVRSFTDKQIALVQSFAAQAVIAIENARLLNELRQRTDDLTRSLNDLRTAQDRLVQTEKLASLGQLTAGIAHEIKNPLNFVNNFSALSAELIEEMKDMLSDVSLDKNKREDLDEITQMLKSNLDKVVQHGKRADSIVKNMLLHSRQGSGEHRPVDINAIVDESLNLAYHGARAENTGFNITMHRSFDPAVGMADGYPQEITRALLNLISNGFYAAMKRKADAGDGFEPTLTAMTKNLGDKVEIRIRDNGTGIPTEVKEKIFNPFFTTKPAGEGTGLGLSMSHDIIVKQHGGTMDVDTMPGVFTEFKIVLPRAGASLIKPGERP
jgi:signal transduction histidine kinase